MTKIEGWLYRFHGVSTKFLNNYLYWFKWLQDFDNDKELIKAKNFLIYTSSEFVKISVTDFKTREANSA